MDERLKFVARLLDGEKMAGECQTLCVRDFCERGFGFPDIENEASVA
jgi:hypothetical protein